MRDQCGPLSPSRPLPLARVRADCVNPPIRRPDLSAPTLGTPNRMHMPGHIGEADNGCLRLPKGEHATGDRILQQEGIAYQSWGLLEISPHSTIGQVHRKKHPEVFEAETGGYAHHRAPLGDNSPFGSRGSKLRTENLEG